MVKNKRRKLHQNRVKGLKIASFWVLSSKNLCTPGNDQNAQYAIYISNFHW